MYIRLSYDFSEQTPYPEGLWPVEIEHVHDMVKGKISNVYKMSLCNHVGTHIDGPNHFSKDKRALNAFDIQQFVFDKPVVIDISKSDSAIVHDKDLAEYAEEIAGCDLLLIRTGFGKVRKQDVKRYANKSPGFAASAARYIADELPQLRAVGMDTLSFACPQHLDEGIKAHQILMAECKHDIFLIEDMNLDFNLSGLKQVFTLPLFCEHIDSAPCTVLAMVH